MVPNQKVIVADALDILFEQRNKAYGAYQLRRAYPGYVARALGIGLLLILTGLGLPYILSAVSNAFPEPAPEEVTAVMGPPPDVDKPLPPPVVPVTPPPPATPTQIFVPPVVVEDPLAPETPPHTVEELELSKKQIGTAEREGDPDAPPSNEPDPSILGTVIENPKNTSDDTVYEFIDVSKLPSFQGGEKDLLTYLAKHINYPPMARENNIQGIVALSFVIDKDGSIVNVSVLKDIGGGCAKEAVRVVQTMPRWNPGEANGNPVKVRFVLPVRFQLQ